MKKSYSAVPYEIFLSELYIDLKDYYHPEHKKSPVFRLYIKDIDYIASEIELYSNNKIKIDLDKSRLVNYNISLDSEQILLINPIVNEMLYPPYYHPNWKEYIKEGLQSYLFENPMNNIVEFFNKADIKIIKESLKEDFIKNEAPIEELPKESFIKKIVNFIKRKLIKNL